VLATKDFSNYTWTQFFQAFTSFQPGLLTTAPPAPSIHQSLVFVIYTECSKNKMYLK
jgi:hypothetical protein